MKYKDYYKILGINKDAGKEDIKRSYRKLAKKYHPDLNPNNEKAQERFKEINEAYEVLGDEKKRKQYDAFGGGHGFTDGQNFDPSQYGFGNFKNGHSYTYSTGGEGFSDFFNMFFGGQGFDVSNLFGGVRRSSYSPPQHYESEISITLQEGYRGVTKTISLAIGNQDKSISVKIPKGILPGKKIKIKGKKVGIDGDIYLKVRFISDSKLKLDGLDIYKEIDIFPWDAALGTKVIVETLDGRIKISIPPNMDGHRKIRLPGKGYVDMDGKRGNMYIQGNIRNPAKLTEEQIELYKQLRDSI